MQRAAFSFSIPGPPLRHHPASAENSVGKAYGRPGRPALVLFCIAILLLFITPALAHRVYIFAWTEGGVICTESYFSKNSKVRGGDVLMLDTFGNTLQTAKTDVMGKACFSPPAKAEDILFVIMAGQGHRGEYLLPAADVALTLAGHVPGENAAAAEYQPVEAAPLQAAGSSAVSASAIQPSARPAPVEACVEQRSEHDTFRYIDSDSLRRMLGPIIREELQHELGALRKSQAMEQKNDGPGFREIVGGLGWIAGFAGFGALYASRRKQA